MAPPSTFSTLPPQTTAAVAWKSPLAAPIETQATTKPSYNRMQLPVFFLTAYSNELTQEVIYPQLRTPVKEEVSLLRRMINFHGAIEVVASKHKSSA